MTTNGRKPKNEISDISDFLFQRAPLIRDDFRISVRDIPGLAVVVRELSLLRFPTHKRIFENFGYGPREIVSYLITRYELSERNGPFVIGNHLFFRHNKDSTGFHI